MAIPIRLPASALPMKNSIPQIIKPGLVHVATSMATTTTNNNNKWSITTTDLKPGSNTTNEHTDSTINHISSSYVEDETYIKHAQLLKHIQDLISKVNADAYEDLVMVDALQRLGIDYHFREEIDSILKRRYTQFTNTRVHNHLGLFVVSLCFRLLRQEGYYISADVFEKFKGKNGKFEAEHREDIKGLMGLYEASQFGIEGEDILDEAAQFSHNLLEEKVTFLDKDQARMVRNTLGHSYQMSSSNFMVKNFIRDFEGTALQELAEMDFNMVQSIRRSELNKISRWWKDLGLAQELKNARDQPLKWYIWPMAALTDPSLSEQRIELTKQISLIYIIDDIFDVYGTLDELILFTEAVNRWDINAIEQLPNYMKACFKALYDITNEIGYKVYKKHGFNPTNSLQKSWSTLFDAFLVEAKWFASGHLPKAEEYLQNGIVSSGIQVVLVHMFFLLGDGTTKDRASLIDSNQGIISSVSTILRLWDDLGSAQDENQEGHDGSYVMCYMKENKGSSIEVARQCVINKISDTWKTLNKECLSPNPFSATFTKGSVNIARMVPLMYSYSANDSLPLLEDYIKSALYDNFARS